MKVYVIINVNFEVMEETSVDSVYASLDDAFQAAIEDVESHDGKNIKLHNYVLDGYEATQVRLTNNNSLGSQYGVSYNSYWGSYRCARMIVECEVK